VPGVADRVLNQVLRDDAQHPWSKRQIDVGITRRLELNTGPRGGVLVLDQHLFQNGQRVRVPECDDFPAALELR